MVVVVMAACTQSQPEPSRNRSVHAAQLQVTQLASAARQWMAENPGKGCPASISDLDEYKNENGAAPDPWGAPLRWACGADLPKGATDVAFWSLGPDGVDGTSDDVHSW